MAALKRQVEFKNLKDAQNRQVEIKDLMEALKREAAEEQKRGGPPFRWG